MEWGKARAHTAWWSEEVELLQEEMRYTKQALEQKAQWWEHHQEFPTNSHADRLVREGIATYADRQAVILRHLSDHFSTLWKRADKILPADNTEFPIVEGVQGDDETCDEYDSADEMGSEDLKDSEDEGEDEDEDRC